METSRHFVFDTATNYTETRPLPLLSPFPILVHSFVNQTRRLERLIRAAVTPAASLIAIVENHQSGQQKLARYYRRTGRRIFALSLLFPPSLSRSLTSFSFSFLCPGSAGGGRTGVRGPCTDIPQETPPPPPPPIDEAAATC